MNALVCITDGCGRSITRKSKSGLCLSCAARRSVAQRVARNRDPEFKASVAAARAAKSERRFEIEVAALDANGRACFDRCIRGGIQPKQAILLANDEMRIYAKAAARGVRPAPVILPVSDAVHTRKVERRVGYLLPEFTASGAQNER